MLQIRHTILVFLAVLLCSGVIVSPVFAADYTVIGPQGFIYANQKFEIFDNVRNLTFDRSENQEVISLIHIRAPQDHTVYFTIYYGTGNEVSGSVANVWNLTLLPLHSTTSTITFNGEEKSYSYLDADPAGDYYLAGYAVNRSDSNQTGLIVNNVGLGSFDNDLAIFMPVNPIAGNLIYRIDAWSDADFTLDLYYGDSADVAGALNKSIVDLSWDWINFAISISFLVFGFVLMVLGIIKFFFIDNLLLVVALWISVTMAYSAISSKNIFMFYKRFFGYQRALLTFIMELWNYLIQIIASFRGIFRI